MRSDSFERATWAEAERVFADTGHLNQVHRKLQQERAVDLPHLEEQRASIQADIVRTEQAIKRYQTAFEAGELSAPVLAPRLRELTDQANDLRAGEASLDSQIASLTIPESSREAGVAAGPRDPWPGGRCCPGSARSRPCGRHRGSSAG